MGELLRTLVIPKQGFWNEWFCEEISEISETHLDEERRKAEAVEPAKPRKSVFQDSDHMNPPLKRYAVILDEQSG